MRRSLTRAERLRSRPEIRGVFEGGRRVSCAGMRLSWRPNELAHTRVAVMAARGFASAVERNLHRRRGKEAYRALKPDIRNGFDLAVVLFPGHYSFAERRNQLSGLLDRARLLSDGIRKES